MSRFLHRIERQGWRLRRARGGQGWVTGGTCRISLKLGRSGQGETLKMFESRRGKLKVEVSFRLLSGLSLMVMPRRMKFRKVFLAPPPYYGLKLSWIARLRG